MNAKTNTYEKVLKTIKENNIKIKDLSAITGIKERTLYRTLSCESLFLTSPAKNVFEILLALKILTCNANSITISKTGEHRNFHLDTENYKVATKICDLLSKEKSTE